MSSIRSELLCCTGEFGIGSRNPAPRAIPSSNLESSNNLVCHVSTKERKNGQNKDT